MRALVACAVIVELAGLVQAQTLGEAAAREKERRKAAQNQAKAYTDEDLERAAESRWEREIPEATPTPEPESDRPERAAPSAASRPSASESAPTPSQMDLLEAKIKRWRAEYSPVQSRIDRLEEEIEKLEDEDSHTAAIIRVPTCGSGRSTLRSGAEVTRERLAAARNELTQAQRKLDQVSEAARRDGVSSGQLY